MTDNHGSKFHRVTFSREEKMLDNGKTAIYVGNDGEPMDKYEAAAADGTKYVIDPSIYPMVELFKVTHPTGDFMQEHMGQKLEGVRFVPLNKSNSVLLKKVMSDVKDFFFPFTVLLTIDGKNEPYCIFVTSKDGYLAVSNSFFNKWK